MSAPSQKVTYLLAMSDPSEFHPKRPAHPELEVRRVEIPCPEFNWYLDQVVGAAYRWGGRQDWDRRRWKQYVDRPELETWVAYLKGTPVGFYELEKQPDRSVQIERLGLVGTFIGQGIGSHLLTAAVQRAWKMDASRVWLSTCSHDHQHALPNYQARGFKVVEQTASSPNPPRQSALFSA